MVISFKKGTLTKNFREADDPPATLLGRACLIMAMNVYRVHLSEVYYENKLSKNFTKINKKIICVEFLFEINKFHYQLKKPETGVYLWVLRRFYNSFFIEHLQTTPPLSERKYFWKKKSKRICSALCHLHFSR